MTVRTSRRAAGPLPAALRTPLGPGRSRPGSHLTGRHPVRARRAVAAALVAVVALGSLAAACSSSNSATSATTSAPTFSVTIPPNATANGATLPADADAGSLPAAGGSGLDVGPSTSVAAENQDFCQIMGQAGAALDGPSSDSASDAQALSNAKHTFQQLTDTAPSSIKPEVQGMNNVIQSVNSTDDIQKLDDPDFTNEQAAVAEWVQQNCGIEVP
jgi:hypothetical protein